jgi:hypothetical protein
MCGLSVAVWRELLAAIEGNTLQELVDDMDKKLWRESVKQITMLCARYSGRGAEQREY